jgi:hypothetical protein
MSRHGGEHPRRRVCVDRVFWRLRAQASTRSVSDAE